MSAALRNLLLKTRKELSLVKATMQDQIEQIRETALATLSDGDLRQLQGGRAGEAGLASARPDQAAVASYRTACEAAAVRFTGRSCPALELSADAVAREIANRSGSKLHAMFPDEGPYRRNLTPRHMEFLTAGANFRERLFMAANRAGKTETGAYEMACHLTGQYPAWWLGKRFSQPVNAWACGTTNGTTRDIVQEKLLGPEGAHGTGMIPAHTIVKVSNKQGLSNAADTVLVKHVSGGRSRVSFKSYESGRKAFEGTAQHVIWLDEEGPLDIYTECLYRTATTDGVIYTTFTPLGGMSDVVKSFVEPESEEAAAVKKVTQCDWSQVPHLDEEAKRQLLASTPPYQRDARTKGIPQLGVGAIYPLAESEIVIPRFNIPAHWPRSYCLDVGWNRTAAVWGALDPESKICYLFREYYRAQAEPVIHAAGIKAVGEWIPGVVDPACLGSSQIDGRTLMEMYGGLGLNLQPAANGRGTCRS